MKLLMIEKQFKLNRYEFRLNEIIYNNMKGEQWSWWGKRIKKQSYLKEIFSKKI
jgi:hypothetical protein